MDIPIRVNLNRNQLPIVLSSSKLFLWSNERSLLGIGNMTDISTIWYGEHNIFSVSLRKDCAMAHRE
ncbi:hypothetical protein CEXT_196151, partial [Caerostris extrusa]